VPPPQNADIGYFIVSTILVDLPTQQQIAFLVDALEEQLLVPALTGIQGFRNVSMKLVSVL